MLCRLIESSLVVLKLLMFRVVELLASQKASFSISPVLKELKKIITIKKIKNQPKPRNLETQHFEEILNVCLVFH